MKIARYTFAASPALLLASTSLAGLTEVTVTIENLAPAQGTYQTPFWVGFHNGQFDLFDMGAAASPGLERLAEDGTTATLSGEFLASGFGAQDGVIGGGPIAPGQIVSIKLTLDGLSSLSHYFSFASMVIPSNDAFVGNGNPLEHRIFASDGTFLGADFFITGAQVYDAGTEVNDELPDSTAFFGQTVPNMGTIEGGLVSLHQGYLGSSANPFTTPLILAAPMFAGADFTLAGYPIARITITGEVIPAHGAAALLLVAAAAGRRKRH